jgi:hypothetical protein
MGEVEPARGAVERATGIRRRQASCAIRRGVVQNLRGETAKQLTIDRKGFSWSFSKLPATREARSSTWRNPDTSFTPTMTCFDVDFKQA